MRSKRLILTVCIAFAAVLIMQVASTFRESYVREHRLVTAELIAKDNAVYLVAQTQQVAYRLSGWTRWKNWFLGWPIWDESFEKNSLYIIEIAAGESLKKHIFSDFVAPVSLFASKDTFYVRDRPTMYEDRLTRRNSPNPFKYYRWEDGEFITVSEQEAEKLAEQVGPPHEYFAARGWRYIEHHQLEDAAESNTPVELELNGRKVTIAFDKTPDARRRNRWFGVRITIDGKLAFVNTFPDKVIDKRANAHDWRAFIESGAHRTR